MRYSNSVSSKCGAFSLNNIERSLYFINFRMFIFLHIFTCLKSRIFTVTTLPVGRLGIIIGVSYACTWMNLVPTVLSIGLNCMFYWCWVGLTYFLTCLQKNTPWLDIETCRHKWHGERREAQLRCEWSVLTTAEDTAPSLHFSAELFHALRRKTSKQTNECAVCSSPTSQSTHLPTHSWCRLQDEFQWLGRVATHSQEMLHFWHS